MIKEECKICKKEGNKYEVTANKKTAKLQIQSHKRLEHPIKGERLKLL